MKRETPPLLLVEDHDGARRSYERLLSSTVNVIGVGSCRAAHRALLEWDGLAGAILDVRLPDGSGLDLVEPLRIVHPGLRILAMTADDDPSHSARANLLDVEFLAKPAPARNMVKFVEQCLDIAEPIARFGTRHGLSPRETEVVALLVEGKSLKQIPDAMGIAPTTVREYCVRTLRKTGLASMDDVVRGVRQLERGR